MIYFGLALAWLGFVMLHSARESARIKSRDVNKKASATFVLELPRSEVATPETSFANVQVRNNLPLRPVADRAFLENRFVARSNYENAAVSPSPQLMPANHPIKKEGSSTNVVAFERPRILQ